MRFLHALSLRKLVRHAARFGHEEVRPGNLLRAGDVDQYRAVRKSLKAVGHHGRDLEESHGRRLRPDDDLLDLGPGWRDRGYLPDAIWAVVAALRRALAPQTESDEVTVPSVRVRGRSGRWLSLQASLTESSGDRAGDVVIVIGPAGPRELTRLRTSNYGLTAREQTVVEQVMRGASTKQIAEWLRISEYTVQDHLSHVFKKVGVRNRRALVKRLYPDGGGA